MSILSLPCYNWNIVESGIKHHKPNPSPNLVADKSDAGTRAGSDEKGNPITDGKIIELVDKAIFRPNEGLINSDDDIIPETRTADEKVADADPWIEM